jgi:hypothetical protein
MPYIRSVLALACVAVIAATAASGQQSAPVDPTVAEIRALKADINERLEANIRVQLLVARLTLQEQRTGTVVRQLSEVSEKLRTHEQTKAQIEAGTKMFGGMNPDKPQDTENNFLLATFKSQIELLAKTEEELKQQQAELTTTLAQEQARWASFNAELAELERLFAKPRR